MATSIHINKLDYPVTPIGSETWTIEYKLWNASTWTLKTNALVVPPSGSVSPEVIISGLVSGQLYMVRASPNCSSPALYYIQNIQL